ncbi:MAG: hypothetical protein ACJ0RU_05205 [Candidatus Rariloculaceae bacterium]
MRRLIKTSILTLGLLGILCLVLLSASVYTYTSLTSESLVAELRFNLIGEREYLARLRTGDFCEEEQFQVMGDQWRLDAEFIKWKYWALALGLDSQYRLDRFEGRYRLTSEQNSEPSHAYDLKKDTVLDMGELSKALGFFNFLVDTTYGSSTYNNIDTENVFYIYRTQTGLITRSKMDALPQRGQAGLVVQVTRPCGGAPGYWQRFSVWADDKLMGRFGL